MTIRCSLLGHRFEEATVEREQEEREDEVLTVSREVETCSRCGARRVVSENTEIRTVDPAPEEAERDAGGPGDRGDDPVASTAGGTGEALDPPDDPAEEDAEILTDEGDGERQPGEWPDEPAATPEPSDAAGTTDAPDREPEPPERSERQPPEPDAETFVCPECGFTTAIAGSSLRQGDACPECMDGYLETR